jgi:hypothetical protein
MANVTEPAFGATPFPLGRRSRLKRRASVMV